MNPLELQEQINKSPLVAIMRQQTRAAAEGNLEILA